MDLVMPLRVKLPVAVPSNSPFFAFFTLPEVTSNVAVGNFSASKHHSPIMLLLMTSLVSFRALMPITTFPFDFSGFSKSNMIDPVTSFP